MKRPALLAVTLLTLAWPLHAQVTITVDAAAARHSISPNIYGVAFASTSDLDALNAPLNRSGGNAETRYNWQSNASNRAADYFFESIAYPSATAGEWGDTFVQDTKAAGAQPFLTVPIIGWVAKLGNNRAKLASFSVAKYGPQQYTDPYFPDAGNGVRTNGSEITGNDPNEANLPVDSLFQQNWIRHLVNTWGASQAGGVRYYALDNEHSIWFATHRDVQPTGPTMDEIRGKIIDYAGRIKDIDANALIAAPEEWGWGGYFYSGYDQQYAAAHGYSSFPDKQAHANWDYVPWLLDQLHSYDTAHGRRLLDILTLHFYPQGGEFSDDVSTNMQLLRNRSTRQLWDPTYTSESWIGDKVKLLPRMRQWVDTYYPGTRIGLTEYNWGAESHMNGATAQADILGILGREGADYATRWTTPPAGSPVFKAMQMYRNYDGAKSTFGDVSVAATGPNPDSVAAFAAVRSSDGALTIMIVNKALSGTAGVTINVTNFSAAASAQRWQLASGAITRVTDVTTSPLTLTLPAQSVTLLVVPVKVGSGSSGKRRIVKH
jgi:hypothetical protein